MDMSCTSARGRLVWLGILVVFLGLSACATRGGETSQTSEPEVKVRGQYDVSIGTVR